MALNNDAVLKVGTGDFYTGEVGAELPLDLLAPGLGFEHMGHSSIDDILNSASEGGEITTLPTLQNPNLRQSIAARTESYNINLHQFDDQALKLFFGANSEITIDGHVRPAKNPVATECSWLFVFRDGDRVGGIYAPKVSIFRGDDFSISDTESLQRLNLRITPLIHDTNEYAFEFIPPHVPDAGV